MLTDAELDAFDDYLDTLDARIKDISASLAENRARLGMAS